MKTCPRCHKQRPDDEVAHTCVAATTRPDHGAAQKWAAEMLRLDSVSPLWKTGNAAACYLDAMAQLDKATELLEAATVHLEDCSRDIVLRRAEDVLQARGSLALEMANRLRAFLDEGK